MGIAFITAKAEKFKHQRDAAFEQELGSANLFSGLPEQVHHTYRFKALTEQVPEAGTPVLIFRSEGAIKAFHLNLPIGIAVEPDASELAEIMQSAKASAFSGQIVEVRPVSRTFVIAVGGAKG